MREVMGDTKKQGGWDDSMALKSQATELTNWSLCLEAKKLHGSLSESKSPDNMSSISWRFIYSTRGNGNYYFLVPILSGTVLFSLFSLSPFYRWAKWATELSSRLAQRWTLNTVHGWNVNPILSQKSVIFTEHLLKTMLSDRHWGNIHYLCECRKGALNMVVAEGRGLVGQGFQQAIVLNRRSLVMEVETLAR